MSVRERRYKNPFELLAGTRHTQATRSFRSGSSSTLLGASTPTCATALAVYLGFISSEHTLTPFSQHVLQQILPFSFRSSVRSVRERL
jgi:hypothetical protein